MAERIFWLDDSPLPFEQGQTVMEAATQAGHYIPHLCHNPALAPHGSCRVCIVSIDGQVRAACTTPVLPDMKVSFATPTLQKQRRQIVELLFAEGNHICPSCEVSGNCQLQALAYDLGMTHYEFTPLYPQRSTDASHPDIFLDQDRCIFCELCSRSAREQDSKNIFGIGGRSGHTYLFAHSDSGDLGDTAFTGADHAAHICPVGCLLPRQGNYSIPIGKRLYDAQPIHIRGNHRPDEQEPTT